VLSPEGGRDLGLRYSSRGRDDPICGNAYERQFPRSDKSMPAVRHTSNATYPNSRSSGGVLIFT
jgi:hypothetical protein